MEPHPYREAFEAGDLDRLVTLLADDVVFHSPVITEPGFEGRDSVAALLAIAMEAITDIEYTHELSQQGAHVLVADARVLGRPVKTTTLLEFDADEKIREIWIMARPLAGVVAIAEAIGTQLASRQGPGRGPAVRTMVQPLRGLAAVVDRTGARLIGDLNRFAA